MTFDWDFYSKCYLTEQKFPNSWVMDVEHFIPQVERPDLIYSWNNLLPAEHRVNGMKPRKTRNTCDLLNTLHNGHDKNSQKATEALRHAIAKKHYEILNKIIEWQGRVTVHKLSSRLNES